MITNSMVRVRLALSFVLASLACSGAPIPEVVGTDDAVMTLASNTPQALKARNKQDMVGRAHNKALEDFRLMLRKPGVLGGDLCASLLDFALDSARLPEGHRTSRVPPSASAREGLAVSGLCKGSAASHTSFSQETLVPELSPAARELGDQIRIAAETSVDRYDLARQLTPLLDAANSLDPVESEILAATISTAQHSFEYWDAQLSQFQQDLWSDYSACAGQYKTIGYSMDDARVSCMEGGGAVISTPRLPNVTWGFRMASAPAPACTLEKHFGRLVGADVVGALVGAVRGKFFGTVGAAAGAIAGGTLSSLGSFIVSTWELFWCAM